MANEVEQNTPQGEWNTPASNGEWYWESTIYRTMYVCLRYFCGLYMYNVVVVHENEYTALQPIFVKNIVEWRVYHAQHVQEPLHLIWSVYGY